jgi:subtilase family serine protease
MISPESFASQGWAMKISLASSHQRRFRADIFILACALIATSIGPRLGAQTVTPRINSAIADSESLTLKGSLHPFAQAQFDAGRIPADTKLNGISIFFNRSAAQEADLQALIAAQQSPASPLYHQWLTPDQFAARFGMAQSDVEKVESWLQQQGFSIDSEARSKNAIRFSGTAGQVEGAFSTEMHYYRVNGVQHFAASTDLSLPAAIAPVVLGIRNLDDFRPQSHAVVSRNTRPTPAFTSSETGNVYFAPGDIVTAYNIKPIYSAGSNGAGQSIAIVGQSAIDLSDIQNFQSAAGLTVKDPTLVLMPGTGASTVYADGDEGESDLDLEWSGAIAPDATIEFVYTGNNENYGAFDAIQYAIDQKIAPIISSSYGECEAELSSSPLGSGAGAESTLEAAFEQAAAQGQTILAAAGDSGSTDCFVGAGNGNPSLSEQEALAVDFPASSPYVTGVGGTEVSQANSAYLTAGDGYWAAKSSSDIISSALQYLPEVAWNEDEADCGQADCIGAGGGGASALFTKPSWQTGVPGIPNDGKRDVPDIAVYASPDLPGYLICSEDKSFWGSGQTSSCSSGFRDASTGELTLVGGTSFGGPIYSGVLALINQQLNYSSGQGLINPTFYTLAANGTAYASAFHDITSGNNDCTAGSADCSSTAGFSAGVGYDQVTGLGSINAGGLATAWPSSTGPTLIDTTTAITASNTAPTVNVADNFTVTVTSLSGNTIPTGTVALTIDGGSPLTPISLTANGTATYATSFSTVGTHEIIAAYSGDSTHAASTGTVSVNVAGVSSGTGTFTLGATPSTLTVAQGSSGTETITAAPASGYSGTVLLTIDTSNDNALQNLCYEFTNENSSNAGVVNISGTAAAATQLTLNTNASACSPMIGAQPGASSWHRLSPANSAKNSWPGSAPFGVAFAGLVLAGFLGRYARKFRALAGLIALAAFGFGLSACTSQPVFTPSNNPPAGTYTITVTGRDSATASITATTSFTFTIQ